MSAAKEEAGIGHNSGEPIAASAETLAVGQLRAFIERIERLEDEKATISLDIREIKKEAKSSGFNMKALAEVLRLRKLEKTEREEREALRGMYCSALGVFG